MIVDDDILGEAPMERNVVTGIAHDRNEARVTLVGLPDRPGAVAAVFGPLAEENINVDMIVQSVPRAGERSDLTFTVPTASLAHSVAALEGVKAEVGFSEILTDTNVVKVSSSSGSNSLRSFIRSRTTAESTSGLGRKQCAETLNALVILAEY